MPTTFIKLVEFEPAYDKRHDDPTKNYGIGGVTMRATLKGPEGAVTFILLTMWNLPHVAEELKEKGKYFDPIPAGIYYHNQKPWYEEQELDEEECPYLDGNPCYLSHQYMHASQIYEALITEGSEGMWQALLAQYMQAFGIPASKATLLR